MFPCQIFEEPAPPRIWQDRSSKLKVDGKFGKVDPVDKVPKRIWQDRPSSQKPNKKTQ